MPIPEIFSRMFSKKEQDPALVELKGQALRNALAEAAGEAGMRPAVVDKFLNFEEPELPVNIAKVASILLFLHLVSLTAVNLGVGANLDPSLQLPDIVHQFFQSIHNLSVNAAESASLRHHFPFLLLEFGGLIGGGAISETIKKHRSNVRLASRVRESLLGKNQRGEINFQMNEGHTAVFSGDGDAYATWLQSGMDMDDLMTYTTNVDGETILTKQGYELSSTQDNLDAALERGDFVKAGEVILLPVTEEDQFLPDPDENNGGFDMTLSNIDVMLSKMENFLEKKPTATTKKKVIIVSSSKQQETQLRGREQTEVHRTLDQLVKEENGKRKHLDVRVVDPTELVFSKLMPLLAGKEPEFIANKVSGQRYGQRFYDEYDSKAEKITKTDGTIRVFYNISDIDTIANVRPDDIAIVSTERHKQALIDDQMDPDRIIVISKLVKEEIENLV